VDGFMVERWERESVANTVVCPGVRVGMEEGYMDFFRGVSHGVFIKVSPDVSSVREVALPR
jgi:hypothetical protein